MCFDVPKIVRSPRCDHGHDEESRNGLDIKIDILDDYIQTPDELVTRYLSECRGVIGTPGGTIGPTWAIGKRGDTSPTYL